MDLTIRVTPRASRNEVSLGTDGVAQVRVTAPPAEGQANKAVVELLAKTLGVPKSAIRIVSGESSRTKRVRVEGITDHDLRAAISRQP